MLKRHGVTDNRKMNKIRCRIIDAEGDKKSFPGFTLHTPEISRPHIGKLGYAEKVKEELDDKCSVDTIKITLDDGTILYGYECWWEPVQFKEK
jgi:hypothetical protein